MTRDDADTFAAPIRKLDRLSPLDGPDRDAIRALPFRRRSVPAQAQIVREGDLVAECCFLLDGYACRNKALSNGGRQIMSFHLPGDLLDVQHLMLPVADHNVQMITPATIAFVPIDELRRVVRERPAVGQALWLDSFIDASVFREWVVNVGRRDARTRIAHLLCEFAVRRQAAGLGDSPRFHLPMTQELIADATGLTAVHVNRMMAILRAEGLIAQQGRELEILDLRRLKAAAGFDPLYLHAAA